jgi:hypothetical protein
MTNLEAIAREAVELAEKATPGPWRYDGMNTVDQGLFSGSNYVIDSTDEGGGVVGLKNGQFIAHAGTHYKELAQGYLSLLEQNARMRGALHAMTGPLQCMECGGGKPVEIAWECLATLKESK